MLPMPPSTTMASTMTDSTSTKLSGLMKPWIAENMPPAMPPNEAPMAKASSLTRCVLMPIARAAISSFADRHPGAADARVLQAQVDDDDDQQEPASRVVVLDRPVKRGPSTSSAGAKLEAARLNGSMRVMPCGPLVMLTGRDRLFMKMRGSRRSPA